MTSIIEKTDAKKTDAIKEVAGPIFGHLVNIEALRSFVQPKMALSRIVVPDFDSRAGEEELPQDFLDSLQPGLWQPIVLVPIAGSDKFMVIAGRRRLRGYAKLGRTEIPYTMPEGIVLKDAKDQAGLQAALQLVTVAENKFRKDLNHWDMAVTMQKQKEAGVPQEQIASMWGVKPPFVSQHLSLFKLQPAVQELCRKHANDPGMFSKARRMGEVDEPEVQVQIAKDAFDAKHNFEVRDVDVIVDRFKANKAALLEKEAERKKKAAEDAAAAKKNGGAADKKDEKKEEPKKEEKDPYGEAKAIPLTIARQLLADHAAKVKKMLAAPNTNKETLAFEKGVQKGLEMSFAISTLPKAYAEKVAEKK